MRDLAAQQVLAVVGAFRQLPSDQATRDALCKEVAADFQFVAEWFTSFRRDIEKSSRGYPRTRVRERPDLEDQLRDWVETKPCLARLTERRTVPTLYLSHDIDYITPTLQLKLKRAGALQSPGAFGMTRDFLESIAQLLAIDGHGAATLFVACPLRSRTASRRLAQWLLDPSYATESEEFQQLIALADRYACDIGIHGSFYSLAENGMLARERDELERALGRRVVAGRQHWLNLPGSEAFGRIKAAGLAIDSTLGWNGAVGFRCGMARPFPIVIDATTRLLEVPLLLMDGPLFDSLRLGTEQVADTACRLLSLVRERGGAVAVNWHDRAAHPTYGWSEAYRQIVAWAREQGFRCGRFADLAAESATC
jgi:hypothetical protein